MSIMIPALFNAIILFILGLLHIYWAAGGRWGWTEAFPEHDGVKVIQPGLAECLIVAAGLIGFSSLHLHRIGWLSVSLPGWVFHYGLWAVSGVFLIRCIGDFRYVGLFKKVTNSQFAFWDTRLYIPLCFVMSLNALLSTIY